MLTDMAARVPVQNHRTKYRAIAAGIGRIDCLELLHVPITEDFKEGDLLTSSGLGESIQKGIRSGWLLV